MKLKLISLLMVIVMAFESIARAADTNPPTKPKPQLVVLIVAIIAITIIVTILYQLYKLCTKLLPNPPPPPPDHRNGGQGQPYSQSVQIPLAPQLSWFGCITNQTAAFLTPDGTNYYDGLMSVNIETSTDFQNWTQCGQVIAWISEDYLKVEELDASGNSISVVTTPNWQSSALIPAFSSQFPASDQRFFRQTPTYQ
jgi:heme/copper-type cytochrome/quinol oxidase subunit 2